MEDQKHAENAVPPSPLAPENRLRYEERRGELWSVFEADLQTPAAGTRAVMARSAAVDELVQSSWEEILSDFPKLSKGIALVAVGGYGRRELFPFSDVDLLFLLGPETAQKVMQEPLQRLNQQLWDAGLHVSAMTRTVSECERFDANNVEFTLSLLDARGVAGDCDLTARLTEHDLPKLIARDARRITSRLLDVTAGRHTKYGDTLFHLEPNIKECPGGLRDAHACEWLRRMSRNGDADLQGEMEVLREFKEAREFLLLVRVFLHLRHGRDDNVLDWQAQDAAAAASLGAGVENTFTDAAYWMRQYFRHARSIERFLRKVMSNVLPAKSLVRGQSLARRTLVLKNLSGAGFDVKQNQIAFSSASSNPAHDPEVVLAVFAAMAKDRLALSPDTEHRIEQALPILSAHLEDGPNLWRLLQEILLGRHAGAALRAMHALGILELVLPEFHGIDALVIRDAYHRYTVDEHTFVLIDTLHELPGEAEAGALSGWATKFAQLLRDLPHPELLLLAALLHDTGKGHAAVGHPEESARMAANVVARLELDGYETELVLDLIRNHLEMSATLRRDVFDRETIRSFAAGVPNPELLRMLTLFTYADIAAVNPDALTAWKAENLWRLYVATTNYLDRSVDDERVAAEANSELLLRVHSLLPRQRDRVNLYLEGFPRRYLQTRTPEMVMAHIEMAAQLEESSDGIALDFDFTPALSELTLITRDRPMLFASMAGALAGWGMNIVTADAFSNARGLVVDIFRFTDTFRTLELNESERSRFVENIRELISGRADLEVLLSSRRRGGKRSVRVRVEVRIDFDDLASTQSTLMQVVAQDTPGLLRALSLTLAEQGCNIEVALVDTEGETAIDVFYLTRSGNKLKVAEQDHLRARLLEAIEQNAR